MCVHVHTGMYYIVIDAKDVYYTSSYNMDLYMHTHEAYTICTAITNACHTSYQMCVHFHVYACTYNCIYTNIHTNYKAEYDEAHPAEAAVEAAKEEQ